MREEAPLQTQPFREAASNRSKGEGCLIVDHEEQTQELEKRLEAVEKEVRELRNDYENQLIIGFELMEEALKVSGATLPNTTPKAQLGEDVMHRKGDVEMSLPTTTSTGGEFAHTEASANAPDVEEEKQKDGSA
ncbi:hypothetical protein FNV43_RR21245 [Rhamnella rubrinervis]|uniref:Uncharacterized protein n=1 Tax=Rhamnella rubrinervis TaxID=2594499 RepID=A0A8K0E1X9_9ROSA|nr:hypothetical protein FNV43_RR21245 [Rhamnella rubrinervis]